MARVAYHELVAILVLVGALDDPFLIAEDTIAVGKPWRGIIFPFWRLFFMLISFILLLGWLCAVLIFFGFPFILCTIKIDAGAAFSILRAKRVATSAEYSGSG